MMLRQYKRARRFMKAENIERRVFQLSIQLSCIFPAITMRTVSKQKVDAERVLKYCSIVVSMTPIIIKIIDTSNMSRVENLEKCAKKPMRISRLVLKHLIDSMSPINIKSAHARREVIIRLSPALQSSTNR